MELGEVERGILEDMTEDTYLLGEIFGSFRGEHQDWTDEQVFAAGRDLVATWLARGWLALPANLAERGVIGSIDELLPLIDAQGVKASYGIRNLWLDLAPKAYQDTEWRGPAA